MMGKRGPKPKPTSLSLLHGNPGKRPINSKEPRPEPSVPPCPRHLTKEARIEWRRIIKELKNLGLVTNLDRAALAAYCQAWGRWVEAERMLLKHGPVIKTPNGSLQFSPYLNLANRAMKQLKEFGALFGLNPSDRTGLEVPEPTGKLDKTIEEFMFGPR